MHIWIWTSSLILSSALGQTVLDFVDPLIGTTNGGHVFPGATLPFGMAKAGADVDQENQGGFSFGDNKITGFSHLHDSGTGGNSGLGNFPLFVQTGCPEDDLNRCLFPKALRATSGINSTIKASPGYFAISLNTSVHAEMTVSNHTALYRFTFPTNTALPYHPLIHADLTDLSDSRSNGTMSVDPATGRLTGSGTFRPSFGIGSYTMHFCADFKGASIRNTGVWVNNRAGPDPKSVRVYDDGQNPPMPAGAWVQFEAPANNQILSRVGVSAISAEQACKSAEREISEFDFDGTHNAARETWSRKLDAIKVDTVGISKSIMTTFWSGAYRGLISPQDYTGENPLWDSSEPYYESFYCIWDSFRIIHPYITLIDPHSQTLMVRTLLDIYRHEGYLPDCRMSFCKGLTQGGSNADVVIADAYLKRAGLGEGIDWNVAYEAVVKDAEVQPPIWTVEGRGGLQSWKTLGYIPADDFDPSGTGLFTRSISRTVEYAYNDFCIGLMGMKIGGKDADVEKYFKRADNWVNLFDEKAGSILNMSNSLVDTGFKGWLQPKYLNGTFGWQDPSFCQPINHFTSCYLNPTGHETYEGGSWLYTFYAPQDMARLILKLGGPKGFVDRLTYFHTTPDLLYMGDEQAFLLIYLFHYAGRPGLSAKYAHFYIPSQFNDTIAGIPGNDDSGAMGSFSTMAMLGLYPVAGQDVYLITPPFFREINLTNAISGKTATVRNVNFDAAYANIYIQSATLDGKPYTKNWVTHDFWVKGGVLELTLGSRESTSWGTADGDLPPSLSTGGFV
ncbi:hypothetical protein PspLS_11199 [Pyricularia sp. CBS 133598]|nr:hypothetical protein PspLS_11199 [Pyricularia sp. CBS 133598]